MVIQRWQSVLLFIAAACMAVFCYVPFASEQALDSAFNMIRPVDYAGFFILNLVIAILLLLAIFMFKNLKRQRMVTLVSVVLMVASAATGLFIVYGRLDNGGLELFGGSLLLIAAVIAALWAYKLMGNDQKLLSSYDRLR